MIYLIQLLEDYVIRVKISFEYPIRSTQAQRPEM